jgi:two-component system response regulator PilR (NtrC family)
VKDHELVDQLRRAVAQVDETIRLKTEAGTLRREIRRLTGQQNIVGHSAKMRAIYDMIQTVAPQSSRVLITGESGTGKELVARAIHENSARAHAAFVTINCGAFPDSLLESELFGHMRGSFTGANENRKGLFQAADGGTLFLDEIGNMSLSMQVKLYRVLQEGKVRPVGSNDEIDVDVRVITATNKDVEKAIASGEFREDLFYRLNVIPIHLPPLRERRDDIPLLARVFLERFRTAMNKSIEGIEPAAMEKLEAYDWPGNVRELENTMERAVALETAPLVSLAVLPEKILHQGDAAQSAIHADNGHPSIPDAGLDLEKFIQDMEREYIVAALEASGGVGTRAAERLRMSYRSFRHYSKKYNIS